MPKINKTHSGAHVQPTQRPITYTITVFNDSGGTLQASFFKDPAVANLASRPELRRRQRCNLSDYQ